MMSALARAARCDRRFSETVAVYGDADSELLRAGFFLTRGGRPQEYPTWPAAFLCTPVDKVARGLAALRASDPLATPVVLLSSGGFAPVHAGHLEMMRAARAAIDQCGLQERFRVVGGFLSPSHDEYVATKIGMTADQSAASRVAAAALALDADDTLSNWMAVCPWEALYVPVALNFTDVLDRLQSYLRTHLDEPGLEVAFVYGADNAGFHRAFVGGQLNVCVERGGARAAAAMRELRSDPRRTRTTLVGLPESSVSLLSSTSVRQAAGSAAAAPPARLDLRIECASAYGRLLTMLGVEGRDRLSTFQNTLHELLCRSYGPNILVRRISTTTVDDSVPATPTISLDQAVTGTHTLQVSRLFAIADHQSSPRALVARPGWPSLDTQLSAIPAGAYRLTDEDTSSGFTRNAAEALLASIGITVTDFVSAADTAAAATAAPGEESATTNRNLGEVPLHDIIDARDFLLGAPGGGLVVAMPDGGTTRAPYIAPFVSLTTRAKMPPTSQTRFSQGVWEANAAFYAGTGITLEQLQDSDCSAFLACLMRLTSLAGTNSVESLCRRMSAIGASYL